MQKDYFSLFFKLLSLILLLLLLALTVLIFLFRPAPLPKIEADQTKTLYYGSPSRGFFTRKSFFDPVTAVKTECLPAAASSEETDLPTVLYIPDLFCSTADALEQMLVLSEQGCRVVSFDFFTSEITYLHSFFDRASFKTFSQRLWYYFNPSYFTADAERFKENKEREISAALSILQSENPSPVLIIAEGFTIDGAKNVQERYPQAVNAVFIAKDEHVLVSSGQTGMAQPHKTKPLEMLVLGYNYMKKEAPAVPPAQRAHEFFVSVKEEK